MANILPNTALPNIYVEQNQSTANIVPGVQPHKNLIIGYKLTQGTASIGVPINVNSESQARTLFGAGSMLHRMAKAYFKFNRGAPPLFALPVAEPAGAKATAEIDLAGTATEAGSLHLFIGNDERVIPVSVGDTAADLAALIVSEYGKIDDKHFSIEVDGVDDTIVDITANHNGSYGNEFVLYNNYLNAEVTPAGITVSLTAWANGAGEADFANVNTLLGEDYYNYMAFADATATVINAIGNELKTRATATYMQHSIAFCGVNATASEFTTLMTNINQERIAVRANDGKPMPNFERAAYDMAFIAFTKQSHPALGLSSEIVPFDLPAPTGSRFSRADRESIFADGGSIDKVENEQVVIERYRTTATTNAQGGITSDFEDLSLLAGVSYGTWLIRQKLRPLQNGVTYDPTLPPPVNPDVTIVNENVISGYVTEVGYELAEGAYIENLNQFLASISVSRTSPSRFDVSALFNYSNAVYIIAVDMQTVSG